MKEVNGWRIPLALLVFIVAGVGAATVLARQAGLDIRPSPPLLATTATLVLVLVPLPLLSSASIVNRLRRLLEGRPVASIGVAGAFLCPYLLYWAVPGIAPPGPILGVAVYVAVPTLLALALPRDRARGIGDALVVLAIWLPVDFRWLGGAFPWPGGGSGYVLIAPLGLGLLLYLMLVVRQLDGVGYSFRIEWDDLLAAIGAFGSFALVGIPLGLWTGFLTPAQALPGVPEVAARAAQIFLFTGLPEEALFRGFVQGLLERWTGRAGLALGAASVLFGAAHLNNGPAPDWRYFMLASLAGWAYGWVYQKTRRIVAPALTHTLVDVTWTLFFKG
jgi:membrane protease YdiL (CAAX protease family)